MELATIVGTATDPGHSFDGIHGGLIDGNDLDGIINGGCTSSVRWPNFDCNIHSTELGQNGVDELLERARRRDSH